MNGRLGNLIDDLRSVSGKAAKQDILSDYDTDEVRFLLRQAYDPNLLHNISFGRVELPAPGPVTLEEKWSEVKNLFDFLSISQSRNDNRDWCLEIFKHLKIADQELLLCVINKNLKAGISIRSINKCYPGLIVVYPVQLALKYDPDKDYGAATWHWSYKLDGMRIFAFRLKGVWHLHTRRKEWLGPEIFTLDHWKPDLELMYKDTRCTFADGEAYRKGLKFEHIQSLVMSSVNKKVEGVKVLQYHQFVIGHADSIDTSTIREITIPIAGRTYAFNQNLRSVSFGRLPNDVESIETALNEALENGYEGIVLRDPNKLYSLKRDKHLLKVKKVKEGGAFEISDCLVVDLDLDEFTHIVDGAVKISRLPVRLTVEQPGDGKECGVGSGLKLHNRFKWAKDLDRIIGKTIEVEHQGYGANGLMRFPTFKRVREDL